MGEHYGEQIWEMDTKKGGTNGGDFETCPPGNYPANIVGLFDIGHHEIEYKGETKNTHQFVVVIESQKKTSKGANFLFAKKYTWSMADNSNWYKLVSALTGKKFAEGEKFDPRTVLGLPCFVMITNSVVVKDGKEKTYHNIESITQFPEGFPYPTSYRPPVCWSIREGIEKMPPTSWVPMIYGETIEALAKQSDEFLGRNKSKSPAQPEATQAAVDKIADMMPMTAPTETIEQAGY